MLIGGKAAYVDADEITNAACVDAAGMTLTECGRTRMRETQTNFFFKAVKEDIMYRAISANDSVYNRTMTLKYEFKGVNDELEEDEDPHNKLKYDQMTSDELITADNAKISILETRISGGSARVAQLTEEIGMLEKDIAASKSKPPELRREKQLAEYQEPTKQQKRTKSEDWSAIGRTQQLSKRRKESLKSDFGRRRKR